MQRNVQQKSLFQELDNVIKTGNDDALRKLLHSDPTKINQASKLGDTPLFFSLTHFQTRPKLFFTLLEYKPDTKVASIEGFSVNEYINIYVPSDERDIVEQAMLTTPFMRHHTQQALRLILQKRKLIPMKTATNGTLFGPSIKAPSVNNGHTAPLLEKPDTQCGCRCVIF